MKLVPIPRIAMSLVVLGLTLFLRPTFVSAQTDDSEQISQLFVDLKAAAIQAQSDSDTLLAYARSGASVESHRNQINRIREHVNNMGKLVGQLRDAESSGSPWQQQAIQQLFPLVKEMADHLTTVINHVTDNPGHQTVKMSEYRDLINDNYQLAQRTANLIQDIVDYDEAKANFDELSQKMEMSQK